MQFFIKKAQILLDYNAVCAPCTLAGFEQLTSFSGYGVDWRTYALESLGMVLMGIIENTMIILFDRKMLTKKQAICIIERIINSKVNHLFIIEKHGFYKIHDVDNNQDGIKLMRCLYNAKNEPEYTSQPLAYMDDDIAETDPIIQENLRIYKYFKGHLNLAALQAIEKNKIISNVSSILDENFKFIHFGITLALNMGDGHLINKMKGNELQSFEFKEYVRQRTIYLAPAFHAERPFFQHIDTILQYSPYQHAFLRYKIGIFPWKNVKGKFLQMVSNNYNLEHYISE